MRKQILVQGLMNELVSEMTWLVLTTSCWFSAALQWQALSRGHRLTLLVQEQ